MVLIFYWIGCIISFILNLFNMRVYWNKSTNDEKFLTVLFWIPFVTFISWIGVILFIFAGMAHFNNLKNSDSDEE